MGWTADDSHHVKITEEGVPGKKATRVVVTKVPPSYAKVGEKFRMGGYLEDVDGNRLAGKNVFLHIDSEETTPGEFSSYTYPDGTWWFEMTSNIVTTWYIYFSFKGDATYDGSRTPTYTTFVS